MIDSYTQRFDLEHGLTPETVDRVHAESIGLLDKARVPESMRYAASVVIEELVTNIMEHSGAKWFELTVGVSDDLLNIGTTDDGMAFDPISIIRSQGYAPDLEEFTNRHLGLYMVKRLCESFEYIRDPEGLNMMVLEIRPQKALG